MQLTRKSNYPEDIQLLKLVADFETQSRLRIRIFDANNNRYEVDLPETKTTENRTRNHNEYEFFIDSKTPGFSVVRKSTQEVKSSFFFLYTLLCVIINRSIFG